MARASRPGRRHPGRCSGLTFEPAVMPARRLCEPAMAVELHRCPRVDHLSLMAPVLDDMLGFIQAK